MSLYALFDKNVLLPIGDKVNHSSVSKELKNQKAVDFGTEEQLVDIQNKKIKALIRHCYDNVPYYRKTFDSLGISPEEIKCREDLQKLPILTKQDIRDNFEDLKSQDMSFRKIHPSSTGGSTGVPLKFISDIDAWSVQKASTYKAWEWYGFYFGEKIFSIGGNSIVKKSKKSRTSLKSMYDMFITRNHKYHSSDMTDDDMKKYYKAFKRLKPSAVRGYASSLSVFARYIERNKLPVNHVKAVLTTGEKLMPEYRSILQRVFRAPVYDAYGAGDGGILSYECYMHEGLHICEDCCVIEITDKQGNVLNDGEVGYVTTTDLANYSFPFIRYHVGDMSYIKKEKCSCGRQTRLLGEVLGRAGKLLYSKQGLPMSPTMLPIMLHRDLDYHDVTNQEIYNKIDKFQIRQDKVGDIRILLKLKNPQESHDQFQYVIDNFKVKFVGSKVELFFVDDIPPMPSGKEDYCISDYNYIN